ncbi:hypothetical protein ACJA23_02395 [Mycoplasma corogypsi]|uniref:hypothetical protein n=1 Tax=Mycoplasma corogypsi TaxID=2106 RepID=UPI003872B1E7
MKSTLTKYFQKYFKFRYFVGLFCAIGTLVVVDYALHYQVPKNENATIVFQNEQMLLKNINPNLLSVKEQVLLTTNVHNKTYQYYINLDQLLDDYWVISNDELMLLLQQNNIHSVPCIVELGTYNAVAWIFNAS